MCKCVVPAGMGYGCECKCRKSAKTTGLVFNPWPKKQVYIFQGRGNVFAREEDIKPGEKSLVVTSRCQVA